MTPKEFETKVRMRVKEIKEQVIFFKKGSAPEERTLIDLLALVMAGEDAKETLRELKEKMPQFIKELSDALH